MTANTGIISTSTMHFNSHAHVERDVVLQLVLITRKHFNSHAHVERDNFASGLTNEQLNFNSHAHVERDHKPQPYLQILTNFNSHAHVERDNSTLFFSVKYTISTHTLTWSVTLTAEATALYFIFQLTRSRGA